MYIGIDVGGTHTDAVLADAASGRCLASAKARTQAGSVLPGVLEALEKLFARDSGLAAKESAPASGRLPDPAGVRRITVSTTLGLNALLTGNTDPVGMLVLPGPGLDPRQFWNPDPLFHVLPGAQDHRGRIVAEPSAGALREALADCRDRGARALGVVSKFSPKNPALEQSLALEARQVFGPDVPVLQGWQCGGSLNFPRRLHTVWCNAALSGINRAFLHDLARSLRERGLTCPLRVLKADAGSFSTGEAALDPASAMGSGPAASLLGVWSLASDGLGEVRDRDILMIDMGGTSTDIAMLAQGQPLLAANGLTVAGRPTLIRTLHTHSLALGGDSDLVCDQGLLRVGPERSGPALALAPGNGPPFGRAPTLTDALQVLGLCALGDAAVSLAGLTALAAAPGCPATVRGNPRALARLALDLCLERLAGAVRALVEEVNARPVYTIRELLVERTLTPSSAVFIGGPATALAPVAQTALGLPVIAPPESAWANALGAALALPTRTAELYADTLLGRMSIPEFGLDRDIDRHYRLDAAKADLLAAFAASAAEDASVAVPGAPRPDAPGPDAPRPDTPRADAPRAGAPRADAPGPDAPETDPARPEAASDPSGAVQLVFAESFAMIDDRGRRGRTLRIRAQRAAGLAVQKRHGGEGRAAS